MAKFSPHLLAILLSTSCLFANTDTINQVTGGRLKDRLEATNQVRGCRLQVVATNQTANYRLQVADNSKTELPSEDQIDQRIKTTTNYELRTANCDNSAESLNCYLIGQQAKTTMNYELRTTNCGNQGCNLDCHLMMDPSTLEEGIKAVGEALGILEKRTIIAERPVTEVGSIPSNSSSQVLRLRGGGPKKSQQSQSDGELKSTGESSEKEADNTALVNAQEIARKVAEVKETAAKMEREASEYCLKATQAFDAKKYDEGNTLNAVGHAIRTSAEMLIKAIEVDEDGKAAVATKYQEAAEKMERAVSEYLKVIQADAAGKRRVGDDWFYAGLAIKASAEMLVKAIEAGENGKVKMATQYQEAAEKLEREASEYYLKAAQADAAGKTDEGESWNNAGLAIEASSGMFVKAIDADENGKAAVAIQYQEAAEKIERVTSEYYLKATQAFAAGKTREGNSWNNAGLAIKVSAEMLVKAIEANENGKAAVAIQYQEAAAKMERATSEYFLKATQAFAAGKIDEAYSWYDAGLAIKESAGMLVKAIEAGENGKAAVVTQYQEAAEKTERVGSEYYLKATQAFAAGKTNEGNSWYNAGNVIRASAKMLVKTIEAGENGKATMATKYQEVVQNYQKAVDQYIQAVQAYAAENSKEGLCLFNQAQAAHAEADAIAGEAETEGLRRAHKIARKK